MSNQNDSHTDSSVAMSPEQVAMTRAYGSEIRRLGDQTWHRAAINEILTKVTWQQLHKQNVIHPVGPDSDHTQYRVDERIQARVKSYGNDPALPCGCVGFENTGDGYQCTCGRDYDRVDIKQYLFSDGRAQLTPLGTAAVVVAVGLLLLAAIALAHGVIV